MIDRRRLNALLAAERQRFLDTHRSSTRLAAEAEPHFLFGLPLHWMRDWPMPGALFVTEASGHRLRCADGHEYIDFCLGDSGAMMGHAPGPVVQAIAAQAAAGLTTMLPAPRLAAVGRLLADTFGLPRWQLALSASDANRFMLRWARAVTGRPRVLVFDGCYHGTVDDALVDRAPGGRTLARASLLGQVHDPALTTVVVPFNDLDAVAEALAAGDVACVLTEPALTNCGLVPARPGFLEGLQALARRHGSLLILDETHTVSSGHGGHARRHGLAPDALVVGKAVAGGLPCAVYGFTEELAGRMAAAKAAAAPGHSGIGTTLAGNPLALAALEANLRDVMTPQAHARMEHHSGLLADTLAAECLDAGLRWSIARLGARLELQFCPEPPPDAAAARAAMDDELEAALHLYWLNRGIVVTPFHNMLLVSPQVDEADVARVRDAFAGFLRAVRQGADPA
jgi:glutamate-1-semialdehyde 2,1-aminomutase